MKYIDHKTVIKISTGDENAFSSLYDAYYSYLNTIAIYYVFDKNVANEIVNNVFINIWNRRESLTYPLNNYMVKSVQNGCLNYIRDTKTHTRTINGYGERLLRYQEDHIQGNHTPLQIMEITELEQLVKKSVSSLPEKCRQILELHLFSGKSASEIASQLNISVSTVRVQIKNGLDKMRLSLGNLMVLYLLFHSKL